MNNDKFNMLVSTIAETTEIAIHDLMNTDKSDVNKQDRGRLWDALYDLMAGLPNTTGLEDLEALADEMEERYNESN